MNDNSDTLFFVQNALENFMQFRKCESRNETHYFSLIQKFIIEMQR